MTNASAALAAVLLAAALPSGAAAADAVRAVRFDGRDLPVVASAVEGRDVVCQRAGAEVGRFAYHPAAADPRTAPRVLLAFVGDGPFEARAEHEESYGIEGLDPKGSVFARLEIPTGAVCRLEPARR